MRVFICLLRGINVGGHHKVKMAELREMLAAEGFDGVATYIQSGNVAFRAKGSAARLAARIAEAFEARFGFRPRIQVLPADALKQVVAECPYADEAAADPKTVHAWFLEAQPADAALEALAAIDDPGAWTLGPNVVYLHTPNGLSRSKIAEVMERTLRVSMTARNWRTVLALASMAEAAARD